MFAVIVSEKGGGTERHEFVEKHEVTIGRVQGNDIILGKGNVSKKHSRLILKDGRFIVVDLKSTNGTYVNGRKVTSPLVVKPTDKIVIGDFTIVLDGDVAALDGVSPRVAPSSPSPNAPQPLQAPPPPVAPPVLDPRHAPAEAAIEVAPEPPPRPHAIELGRAAVPALPRAPEPARAQAPALRAPEQPRPPELPRPPEPAHLAPDLGRAPAPELPRAPVAAEGSKAHQKTWEPPRRDLERDKGTSPRVAAFEQSPVAPTRHTSPLDAHLRVVGDRDLHGILARLEDQLDLDQVSPQAIEDETRWTEAERLVERAVRAAVADHSLEEGDHAALIAAAVREAVGLGALEVLLADPRTREIVVSSPSHIEVDLGEGLELHEGSFSSGRMLMTVLARLAAKSGVALDRNVPVHELLLPDGAVATILLPPLSLSGPVVELRRVHASPSLDELVASNALSADARAAIDRALTAFASIAVVGPSGSGVTSLIAAMCASLPATERRVVVSAGRDLRLDRPNAWTLAVGAGAERSTLAEVVSQASRLRSDRLVVDGVGSADLAPTLVRFAERSGGEILGYRARVGDSSLSTLLRDLTRGGTSAADAESILAGAISVVVELEPARAQTMVRRVLELRRGVSGRLELSPLAR